MTLTIAPQSKPVRTIRGRSRWSMRRAGLPPGSLGVLIAGLLLLAITLVAGIGSPFFASGASAASAAPAPESTVIRQNIATDEFAFRGCPLTGDLVFSPEGTNTGNPEAIAQSLCGPDSAPR